MTTDTPAPKPSKPPRRPRAAPKRARPHLSLELHRDFLALCEREQLTPTEVLKGFIADLCDIRAWTAASAYASHSEAARAAARAYHAIVRRPKDDEGGEG